MTDEVSSSFRESILNTILKLVGFLFLSAVFAGIMLSLMAPHACAAEINPSVDNQPLLCKYSITKWICDMEAAGPRGLMGYNGTQGIQGLPNFSTIYYNASNFTAYQNASIFINSTNFTSNSNYTVFEGATVYNGTVNDSYVTHAGQDGGQSITGGTTTGDLVLNGSANNGNIFLQTAGTGGGNVVIGTNDASIINDGGRLRVDVATATNALSIQSRSGTAAAGPVFVILRNSTSPAVNDLLGYIKFSGRDSASLNAVYGAFYAAIVNPVAGSTEGEFRFDTLSAGTLATRMRLAGPNLGIGTTPTSMLDVSGSTRFRNCSGTPSMDAGGNMTCVSDEKMKTAIQPYITDSSKIQSVTPISYKYNAASGFDTAGTYTGFSATELQKQYPECVIARKDGEYRQVCKDENCETVFVPSGTSTLSLDDRCLIAVLFNAVKEQQLRIGTLEKKLEGAKV